MRLLYVQNEWYSPRSKGGRYGQPIFLLNFPCVWILYFYFCWRCYIAKMTFHCQTVEIGDHCLFTYGLDFFSTYIYCIITFCSLIVSFFIFVSCILLRKTTKYKRHQYHLHIVKIIIYARYILLVLFFFFFFFFYR